MNYSPILIVSGEPNSIFLEILFKTFKYKKIKSPIILVSSEKLLKLQMKKLKYKKKIKILNPNKIEINKIDNKSINLVNIEYSPQKAFQKITTKSKKFIEKSFPIGFKVLNKYNIHKFINGPISKKNFLSKKYLGLTEYISDAFSSKKTCMLIYNKELSVCPITTHLPIRSVSKKISKKSISEKVQLIDKFYKKRFNLRPAIGVLGLNPHCEIFISIVRMIKLSNLL